MSQQKHPEKKENFRKAAALSGIAIQMGATIFLGNLFGEWLDFKFQKNYLENTVTMLCIFLSMYFVIKKVMTLSN